MTTPNRKSMFCQRCGKLTSAGTSKCEHCHGTPIIQSSCSVSEGEQWMEKTAPQPGSKPYTGFDAFKEQLDFILQENKTFAGTISSLEKELLITKAGLETLLGELSKKKLLRKSDFIEKWALQTRTDFKGLKLKELYLSRKWDILGNYSGKEQGRYESLLDEADNFFAILEWEKAYQSLRSAEKLSDGNFSLTGFLAQFALEMEKFEEAKKYTEKSLTEKPLPLETLKLATLVNIFSKNGREALKYADKWIKEAGECYEALLIKAFIKFVSGKWNEAGKCSEKAIAKDEGLIPHLILAFSLIRQEKTRSAGKVLEKASRFYPRSPEIKHMQHALYLLNGSAKEAVSVKSMLVEAEDLSLCRKRERLLSANKIESFLETVKPDIEMVLSDLSFSRLALS
jgi:tetratricopeptide (TPR) repeat protein